MTSPCSCAAKVASRKFKPSPPSTLQWSTVMQLRTPASAKAPFPRPCPPGPTPTGKPEHVQAGQPMPGPPLGFTRGPEDLLVDAEGNPCRIDKGFSWEHPVSAHGLMHMVIHNAWAADPYPVDTVFFYMANMAWNSSMNTKGTMDMLTDIDEETGEYRIPHIIYSDAYASEMTSYADLVLPVGDQHSQDLIKIEKDEDGLHQSNLGGCRFVKLVGKHGWKEA